MEQITIDFLPAGATAVCHASQFDAGRVIRMNLRNDGAVYTLSGSEIIKAKITRPDGTSIVENIENTASSYVDLVTSAGTCDVSGTNKGELVIEKDGATIGSKNFRMEVEEDAYGGAGGVVVESASGAIVSFETDIEDELVELKAEIEPVQDLHGYTHPWAGGAGKNLCPPMSGVEANGLTTTVDSDGKITVSGTATGTGGYLTDFVNLAKTIPSGTAFSASVTSPPPSNLRTFFDEGVGDISSGTTKSNNIKWNIDITKARLYLFTTAGQAYNFSFYYQIEERSSATEYEPYENDCPISGHDEVNITRTGKNKADPAKFVKTSSAFLWGYRNEGFLLKGGKTYTLSINQTIDSLRFVSVDEQTIYAQRTINNQLSYTPTEDVRVVFRLWKSNGITADQIQLEEGSSATEYLPYAGEKVTVTFGQTVYKGYLDAKNNRLILTFVLVDLGSLTWGHSISDTRNFFYTTRAFEVTPKGVTQGRTNDDISSEYRCATYANVVSGYIPSSFNIPNTTKSLYLYDASKANMTAEEFKAAVAGVQLLYEIETPVEIPLSAIKQIETISGENNVYNDTGETSLKYYKQEGRATA